MMPGARSLLDATGGSQKMFDSLLQRIEHLGGAAASQPLIAAAAGYVAFAPDLDRAEGACIGLLSASGTSMARVGEGAHAIRSVGWDGRDGTRRPQSDDAIVLWHAAVLHRLDPDVHLDHLVSLPHEQRAAEAFTAQYRNYYIREAHRLDGLIWLAPARAEADRLKSRLHVLLDDLESASMHRFPPELHHLFELVTADVSALDRRRGLPAMQKPRLIVASPTRNWRSELEASRISSACERLATGADPQEVRRRSPREPAAYETIRRQLRDTISRTQRQILELASERIEAARSVAYEKFLEGDTLYKPDREQALFMTAERTAAEIGLSHAVARDLALVLLTGSRLAQEGIYDELAASLGRQGALLSSNAVIAEEGELTRSAAPLVASPSPQLLLREHQIVHERRMSGANRTRRALAADPTIVIPGTIRDHMIAGSRNLDLAMAQSHETEVQVVLRSHRPLHMGHVCLLRTLAAFQAAGYRAAIAVDDLAPSVSPSRSWEASLEALCSRTGVQFSDVTRRRTSHELEGFIESEALGSLHLDDLVSSFGLSLDTGLPSVVRTLGRVACLGSGRQAGVALRILISGLDMDGEVCLARRASWASGDWPAISALYLRMVKALVPPEGAQGTRRAISTGAVMETTRAGGRGRVSVDDSIGEISVKISRAETGGRGTADEQRALGGNPDPRFCSVSSVLASFSTEATYNDVVRSCLAGSRLCGECKREAARDTAAWLTEGSRRRPVELGQSGEMY